MRASILGSLIITYAVIQTVVFLGLIRFLDLYEREPIPALAIMSIWGAVGATSLSAIGNVTVQRLLPEKVDLVFGNVISAPVVEELAKGAALVAFLLVSVWARGRFGIPNFGGVTDGIVYGAAVGLGFAFTEDILYLLLGASEGGLEEGLVSFLRRRDFFGLSLLRHAIYTSAFGVGLGLATWSRRRIARIGFPAIGLLLAIGLHAINNGLVQLVLVARYGFNQTADHLAGLITPESAQMSSSARGVVDVIDILDLAVVLLFVLAVQLWLRYQRRVIREELGEEADAGLITHTELDLMPRYWRRTVWYWHLLRTGQWERLRLLKRLHNELVDFAFLKHRTRTGIGQAGDIEKARRIIEKLKAQKLVFLVVSGQPSKPRKGVVPELEPAELAARVELLSGLEIFEGASTPSLERLAEALEATEVEAGEFVIKEGRIPTSVFIVRSGKFDVLSLGERREAQTKVNELSAGDYFGEIGLLEGMPSTASVKAATKCGLFKIRGELFLDVVDESDGLSDALRRRLAGALAATHPSYRPAADE